MASEALAPWSELSTELIEEVCSFLDPASLASIRQVCRQWAAGVSQATPAVFVILPLAGAQCDPSGMCACDSFLGIHTNTSWASTTTSRPLGNAAATHFHRCLPSGNSSGDTASQSTEGWNSCNHSGTLGSPCATFAGPRCSPSKALKSTHPSVSMHAHTIRAPHHHLPSTCPLAPCTGRSEQYESWPEGTYGPCMSMAAHVRRVFNNTTLLTVRIGSWTWPLSQDGGLRQLQLPPTPSTLTAELLHRNQGGGSVGPPGAYSHLVCGTGASAAQDGGNGGGEGALSTRTGGRKQQPAPQQDGLRGGAEQQDVVGALRVLLHGELQAVTIVGDLPWPLLSIVPQTGNGHDAGGNERVAEHQGSGGSAKQGADNGGSEDRKSDDCRSERFSSHSHYAAVAAAVAAAGHGGSDGGNPPPPPTTMVLQNLGRDSTTLPGGGASHHSSRNDPTRGGSSRDEHTAGSGGSGAGPTGANHSGGSGEDMTGIHHSLNSGDGAADANHSGGSGEGTNGLNNSRAGESDRKIARGAGLACASGPSRGSSQSKDDGQGHKRNNSHGSSRTWELEAPGGIQHSGSPNGLQQGSGSTVAAPGEAQQATLPAFASVAAPEQQQDQQIDQQQKRSPAPPLPAHASLLAQQQQAVQQQQQLQQGSCADSDGSKGSGHSKGSGGSGGSGRTAVVLTDMPVAKPASVAITEPKQTVAATATLEAPSVPAAHGPLQNGHHHHHHHHHDLLHHHRPHEKHLVVTAPAAAMAHVVNGHQTVWHTMLAPLQNLVVLRMLGYDALPPARTLAALQCLPCLKVVDLRTHASDQGGSSDMPLSSQPQSHGPSYSKRIGNAHLQALSMLTGLTGLHLSNVTSVTPVGLSHLHALSRLRSLSLCDALSGLHVQAAHIQALAAALPGLKCLALGRTVPFAGSDRAGLRQTAAQPTSWGNAIAQFTGLRYLGLQFVHCLDEPVLGSFAQLLHLKTLDLEGLGLSYGEIGTVLVAVQETRALRHLRFSDIVLYDVHLSSIAQLTGLCQLSLQHVDVWTRDLSGWTCLSALTALTRFEFQEWNNPVLSVGNLAVLTDESVTCIAAQWRQLRELRYLGKVVITVQSRRALASLPHLSQLHIIAPDGTCCVGARPRTTSLAPRPSTAAPQQPILTRLARRTGVSAPGDVGSPGCMRQARSRWDMDADGSQGAGNGSTFAEGATGVADKEAVKEAAAIQDGSMQFDDAFPHGAPKHGGSSGGGSGGVSVAAAVTAGEQLGEAGAGGLQVRLLLPSTHAKLSSCNGYLAHSGTPSLDGSEGSEDSVNWDGPDEDMLEVQEDTYPLTTKAGPFSCHHHMAGNADACLKPSGNGSETVMGAVPDEAAVGGPPGERLSDPRREAQPAVLAGDGAGPWCASAPGKRAREAVPDLPAQVLQMKTQQVAASLGTAVVQRPASSATKT